MVVPLSKYLRSQFRKWYFDTTTGCIILWLCIARWKGPFLNGNSVSSCERVPSGNINILFARFSMASHSLFKRFRESLRFLRSMNKVPQSQAPVPNGNAYNIAFFATTVARPRIGHKWARTDYFVNRLKWLFVFYNFVPTKSIPLWWLISTTPPLFGSILLWPRTSNVKPSKASINLHP